MRILPSSETTGDVCPLRPRRETRTQAGRASFLSHEAIAKPSRCPVGALADGLRIGKRRHFASARAPTRRGFAIASHVLPHVTFVASCGVFVIFRDAERFVFRARTDPKDATPRRRCGEVRANITSSEAELDGRLRPSNRSRRHGVAAAEPPFGREFSCFSPEGSTERDDKPPFQRRKTRFSAAMKNQG